MTVLWPSSFGYALLSCPRAIVRRHVDSALRAWPSLIGWIRTLFAMVQPPW
jgi:hypothetical protein